MYEHSKTYRLRLDFPGDPSSLYVSIDKLAFNFDVELVDSLDQTERGEGGLGSTGK